MSEDKGGAKPLPQLVIDQTGESVFDRDVAAEARAAETETGAAVDAGAQGGASRFQDATLGFIEGVGRRAWAYADAHPHTVLYGAIGLLLAVLILVLGLWHTIVIAIFVGVGAAIGQARDGEGGIYRFFSRLFGGKR